MKYKTSLGLRALGSALLFAVVLGTGSQERPPLRLKPGDTVSVTTPYGGEMTVQPDGAVYGMGFRAVLEGKTVTEAQDEMRRAMREFVRSTDVFLTILSLRTDVVYVVGLGGGKGPVDLVPDMTLRQLLSTSELEADTDRVDVKLFRDGNQIVSANAESILGGKSDHRLQANDVVTLSPAPFARVWVLGQVKQPGELKVSVGSDVYKAIGAAGGFITSGSDSEATQPDDVRVTVRRGPQTTEFPLRPVLGAAPFALEPGDTVSVMARETRRVAVLGEVMKPGEYVLRGNGTLLTAVAAAGGPNSEGTLSSLMVMRKGEMFQLDATDVKRGEFAMEAGDLVYVNRNEQAFTVLGQVLKPGRFLFKKGETVRATDALAAAGGLDSKGTMRRVYLARADESGHTRITQFHLDDYLKSGDEGANPVVLPGDYLLFGQPKGITIGTAMQAISGTVLIESLLRR